VSVTPIPDVWASIQTVEQMEYMSLLRVTEYSLLESKIIHFKPILYLYGNNTDVIGFDWANIRRTKDVRL